MVIPEVEEQLKQLNVENVVLMGIEVCSICSQQKYYHKVFLSKCTSAELRKKAFDLIKFEC